MLLNRDALEKAPEMRHQDQSPAADDPSADKQFAVVALQTLTNKIAFDSKGTFASRLRRQMK